MRPPARLVEAEGGLGFESYTAHHSLPSGPESSPRSPNDTPSRDSPRPPTRSSHRLNPIAFAICSERRAWPSQTRARARPLISHAWLGDLNTALRAPEYPAPPGPPRLTEESRSRRGPRPHLRRYGSKSARLAVSTSTDCVEEAVDAERNPEFTARCRETARAILQSRATVRDRSGHQQTGDLSGTQTEKKPLREVPQAGEGRPVGFGAEGREDVAGVEDRSSGRVPGRGHDAADRVDELEGRAERSPR